MRMSNVRGRRLLAPFAALLVALSLPTTLLSPPAATALLLLATLLLLADRAATQADLRRLAAQLATADLDAKLEVSGGAWGELCHAINRLLQQRRSQQRLQNMLAAPPASLAAELADLAVPPAGLACEVAVLAIGLPAGPVPADTLAELARVALAQAELHGAFLTRADERLLLIFGALGNARPEPALRAAHRAAYGLRDSWAAQTPARRPALALAGGPARAHLLPGLGFSVLGPPLSQALALLESAPPATLLCSETAYVHLRRLGSAPPLPATPRAVSPAGPITYAVPM